MTEYSRPWAKIAADSVGEHAPQLTTMLVRMPRCILAEFNTHRMFSRNAASSRAIPVVKLIERVMTDPFAPLYWDKNQKGMQASEECDALVDIDKPRVLAVAGLGELRRHHRHVVAREQPGALAVGDDELVELMRGTKLETQNAATVLMRRRCGKNKSGALMNRTLTVIMEQLGTGLHARAAMMSFERQVDT